jgi:hypothetical protein
MTLDERVRAGLHRAADASRLDEDGVFEQVHANYQRAHVRARVLRQATTVAIVLTLIAGIGVFISWRAAPERYRTTATVAVTQSPNADTTLLARSMAAADLRQTPTDPRGLATLLAGHALSDGTRIQFAAKRMANKRLSLAVTARSTSQSSVLTREWIAVLTRVREDGARRQIQVAQAAITAKVRALHLELQRIDAKLAKMDPLIYGGVPRFDAPSGNLPGTEPQTPPPPVPEQGSVAELNLAFLRLQILTQVTGAGEAAAQFRFAAIEPETVTRILAPTSTTRVSHTPAATWVALSGWFVALLLVLIGSVFIYRRRASSAPATGS